MLGSGLILGLGGLIAVVMAHSGESGDVAGMILAGVVLFAVGLMIHRAANTAAADVDQYNRTTYLQLKEQWERTWLCLRCGHRFEAKL